MGVFGAVGFSKFVPGMFKYGDIPSVTFAPDRELNILIYTLPSCLIVYRSRALLEMVRFFWPTLYILYICRCFWFHEITVTYIL